ncbi:porin family protein, partial [Ornithobacterium rhinotracheale]
QKYFNHYFFIFSLIYYIFADYIFKIFKEMKKILLLGAMALFGFANAQVNYGFKAGYNLSNLSVQSPISSAKLLLGNKSGFNVGAFVEYGLGNNLSLQGELAYSNVGGRLKYDNNLNAAESAQLAETLEIDLESFSQVKDAKAVVSLGQISVPVSLKYQLNEKVALLGGFSVNFKAGLKTKLEASGKDIKTDLEKQAKVNFDEVAKKELASTNFGLHLGGEYNINNNIFVDARYNFGLSSLNKNYTDFAKLRQRYLQIGLGYKF